MRLNGLEPSRFFPQGKYISYAEEEEEEEDEEEGEERITNFTGHELFEYSGILAKRLLIEEG